MRVINRTVPCLTVVASLAFVLCLDCTFNRLAGVGSEVTNGAAIGRIITAVGIPAVNVEVALVPEYFDPIVDPAVPAALKDTTDDRGRYRLSTPQPGRYSIEVVSIEDRTRALIRGVALNPSDTARVMDDTLHKTGAIVIELPDSVDRSNGYVYLPGTTIGFFLNDAKRTVRIDSVPAGEVRSVRYGTAGTTVQQTLGSGLVVVPERVNFIIPAWRYSTQITLNTTPSGANVSGPVYNFPVLVRLDAGVFDFSGAKSDGTDLRFRKNDGTPLPYEIERYDASARHAEIWVRVDTIFGNNATQAIAMVWGNQDAAGASNGAAVFDTGKGFQAVWHLGEPGGTTANDATGNGYHGAPFNMAAASAVAGAIGIAQEFDGSSSYIQVAGNAASKLNFPQNGDYSISAWVNAKVLDSIQQMIVSKGNGLQYHVQIKHNLWEFAEYQNQAGWDITTSPAVVAAWKLVTCVRQGPNSRLYVDGTCVDNSDSLVASTIPRDTGYEVNIGRRALNYSDSTANHHFFNGTIDEVRLMSNTLSDDWVRLCYMNQKMVDALVVFGKR